MRLLVAGALLAALPLAGWLLARYRYRLAVRVGGATARRYFERSR